MFLGLKITDETLEDRLAFDEIFVEYFNAFLALPVSTQVMLYLIVHFTVVCLVAKPLNRSEAKGDLVMIQTLLLLKCKLICYHAN